MGDESDTISCAYCGTELPAHARYCFACGLAVADFAPVRQPVSADTERANGAMQLAHLAGERRVVTFLFADVVGSTALAKQTGPEDWAAIMNRAFDYLSPIVERYDGIIARLMGDALLAFFGAPVAHEDDPLRAVSAGLDMLSATREFANALMREYGIRFAVRVGVSTGPVVLGDIGTNRKYEYTAMGDAVNLAAKLQAAAQPMTLLIGEDTYRRVADTFNCAPRGTIRVAGRTKPEPIFEVLWRTSIPGGDATGSRARFGAPRDVNTSFVGRSPELAAMRSALDDLKDGRGGLITVTGDAGIGKTRLIMESRLSTAPAVLWLEGRSSSLDQTLPYGPFLEVFREYSGVESGDSDTRRFERLKQRVIALFPNHWDEILPYLASLLHLDTGDPSLDRLQYLDGEGLRRQIFRVALRTFERLGREQPLVLLFEDVHWMDQSSLDLLEHLLPLTRSVPLLICCTTRPDLKMAGARLREIGARQYADRFRHVELGPLTGPESELLLDQLLASDERSTRLRSPILAKAEGNPFFIEEVVRSLGQARTIVWTEPSRRWRAAADTEDIALPDTIQGVLTARLDQLDQAAKELLKLAAVVGRHFSYRVLRALMPSVEGAQFDGNLRKLQDLDLIRGQRGGREQEYDFKHVLIQKTVYESILVRQRRELHRLVARTIEALFDGKREDVSALLAYHYACAEEWERAYAYLLLAGDHAGRFAADAEALAYYRQALVAHERHADTYINPVQQALLERKMGEALLGRGEHREARAYLERALEKLGWTPRSRYAVRALIVREIIRLAWHLSLSGVSDETHTSVEDPDLEERMRIYRSLGMIYVWSDRERFLLLILWTLHASAHGTNQRGEAEASAALGMACDLLGRFEIAGRLHRRAVALANHTGHPHTIGLAQGLLGHHYDLTGKLEDAQQHYSSSASVHYSIGDIHSWASIEWGYCFVLCQAGAYRDAESLSREMLRLGEEVGDRHVQGWGYQCLGESLMYRGLLELAEEYLEKARAILAAVPDRLALAYTLGNLGDCRLRRSNLTGALAVLRDGKDHVDTHRVTGNNASAVRTCLAEAYLRLAECMGGTERERALVDAREACRGALAQGRVYPLALPAAYRARGTYEWLKGNTSAAERWWERSLESAKALGLPYQRARTHQEFGSRRRDPAHLEQAATLLESLESGWRGVG